MLVMAMAVAATGGCVTSTAHRLPLVNNPARAEAVACEARCRALLVAHPLACTREDTELEVRCVKDEYVDRDPYARCLDGCPGATAIDGANCPDPPQPGVVCEGTVKANPGGIIGGAVGVVAVIAVMFAFAIVGASATILDKLGHPQ